MFHSSKNQIHVIFNDQNIFIKKLILNGPTNLFNKITYLSIDNLYSYIYEKKIPFPASLSFDPFGNCFSHFVVQEES